MVGIVLGTGNTTLNKTSHKASILNGETPKYAIGQQALGKIC